MRTEETNISVKLSTQRLVQAQRSGDHTTTTSDTVNRTLTVASSDVAAAARSCSETACASASSFCLDNMSVIVLTASTLSCNRDFSCAHTPPTQSHSSGEKNGEEWTRASPETLEARSQSSTHLPLCRQRSLDG